MASGSSSLGAISSSRRSGYGWIHGTSANECSEGTRRPRLRMASRHTVVAMRYSQARRFVPGSKVSRAFHARTIVSCTASSASSNEPSMR